MRGRNLLWYALASGAFLVSGSCKDVVGPVPVESISVSNATLDLVPGENVRLTVALRDAVGEPLERPITWTTSSSAVASVENGLVTAVGIGTATITASSEGKTATAFVTVEDGGLLVPAGGIIHAIGGAVEIAVPAAAVISQSRLLVRVPDQYPPNSRLVRGSVVELRTSPSGGGFAQPALLSIRYDPKDLGGRSESTLQIVEQAGSGWKEIGPSNVNVANHTVSTRVSEVGVYGIFVEAGVASVRVSPENPAISVGGTTKLSAFLADDAGNALSGRAISWASSNPQAASIDPASGDVTGVSPGSAVITANSETVSGSTTVTVSIGAPTRIRANDGDGQSAQIKTQLPTSPSVIVTDAAGFPVAGVPVTFTVTAGGGSVSGATPITDGSGIARVGSWTLGASAGGNRLSATAPGLDGSPVVFTATAQGVSQPLGEPPPSPPAAIAIFAGDNQVAPPNTAVSIAPAVKVTDNAGVGVPGVTVTFSMRSGGGSITGEVAVTNSSGIATLGSWILGSGGGNSIFATLAGVSGSPLIFIANAIISNPTPGPSAPPPPPPPPPGSPCSLTTATAVSIAAGDNQTAVSGFAVPVRPAVKVTNASGQPVCGVVVTFSIRSGGGSVAGATPTSDENGIATVGTWTLGPPGGNSLFATLNGASGSPLVFVANATFPAGAGVRIVTFGDSNTDVGWAGNNPNFVATAYISSAEPRMPASGGNSPYQLAGKIEARWTANSSKPIAAVNHAISATSTGAGRTPRGAPNAREIVGGVTRYEGEVMGSAYPWSGGEPGNVFYPSGAISRTKAFSPGANDFVYVSMGTNDPGAAIPAAMTAANLEWMIDLWVNSGHAANHFLLTTLAPYTGTGTSIPDMNSQIRALAARRGVRLIDLAARTSNDNGLTWKTSADHVGDGVHYAEGVRDWIADQVVSIMLSLVPN